MAKRAVPVAMQNPGAVVLPKGATDAELKMIVGALMMMLTLIFFAFNRRQHCPG
jgi:Ca-activated chloride channel family protein